jgi:hypothetical protein
MPRDYRDFFSNFVGEGYVETADDEALEYAWEYSEKGGSPKVCVGLALYETDNLGWGLEEIADELGITRRSIYDSREELDLVDYEVRGRHVSEFNDNSF